MAGGGVSRNIYGVFYRLIGLQEASPFLCAVVHIITVSVGGLHK